MFRTIAWRIKRNDIIVFVDEPHDLINLYNLK